MKKILIVEDEPGHLKTIIDYLISVDQHYEIMSASNGRIACSIAESEIPDLIIMDWDLPIMNGIEATIKLKSDETTRAIPVIMCTGTMLTSEDLQTAFNAGAIDYIRKPVDKIELTSRVRSMLMLAEYFKHKNIAESKVNDLTKEIHLQEIKHLQMEVEFKNKELTSKAMFLLQKDEIILKTINKLQDISASASLEVKEKTEALIKDLQLSHKENSWKDFEVYFEKVHEGFYDRLKTKYPDLTSNEKKLCGFIRLNLATKEICSLTQQSPKSIEVARTRLRQKMNLSRDENLNICIASI